MQPPTAREVIKRLENEGWLLIRQKGSHRQYAKGNQCVTVPGNQGDTLTWRTWSNIKRQAGW